MKGRGTLPRCIVWTGSQQACETIAKTKLTGIVIRGSLLYKGFFMKSAERGSHRGDHSHYSFPVLRGDLHFFRRALDDRPIDIPGTVPFHECDLMVVPLLSIRPAVQGETFEHMPSLSSLFPPF